MSSAAPVAPRPRSRPSEKLMRAFLEPEVFEGGVHMRARRETTAAAPLIEL